MEFTRFFFLSTISYHILMRKYSPEKCKWRTVYDIVENCSVYNLYMLIYRVIHIKFTNIAVEKRSDFTYSLQPEAWPTRNVNAKAEYPCRQDNILRILWAQNISRIFGNESINWLTILWIIFYWNKAIFLRKNPSFPSCFTHT